MIKIVDIKKTKTGYSVTFSTGEVLKFSEATKFEFFLYLGKEVDLSLFNELQDYEMIAKAYSYVLMLLSRGSYSSKMVKEKLVKKAYSEEVITRVISRAEEGGILNDEEYARARLNYMVGRKNASKKAIMLDLKAKGINEFTISDLLYEFPTFEAEALSERLIKLMRKYKKLELKARQEKIKAKLYSEGFPLSLIKAAIAEAESSGEFNEDN